MAEHLWLEWVKSLRAISQTGLHFSRDPFDTERYQQVREIAGRILEQQSNLSRQQIVELDASDLGYATPKVDVRGAVFQDGRILLVREISDHGRWTLPGGWADPNETPSEAVAREVREESGYLTRVRKLVGLYDRDRQGLVPPYPFHIYKHFFLCEIVGGAAMGSVETSEVAFFAEDELPELSVARVSAHLIRRCFAHHRQPELATDFD
jgi:ADP-ribose pyrophosphatase YjhB (NUDIX family)